MKKCIAILDCLAGDNGKGRASHWFGSRNQFDWCIRPNSGSNAGHQIYRDGRKYSHHLLPCANYNTPIKSYLGAGMMIDLEELLAEINLFRKDYPDMAKSIYVDADAFIVSKEHIQQDREKNGHLMTTGKGIGPATVDKYNRTGTRIYNLINDNADIIKALSSLGVTFTYALALRNNFEKSSLLFEGAQGILLDLQSGIYNYVTTTDTTVSGIYASGFHFVKLDRVYGVIKAGYMTKSGAGPLPTEMPKEEALMWRTKGAEFGVTTGRDRRIAYMDFPMLKYGILKGGITHLILTKLDIMNGAEKIKVCYDYGKEIHSPNDFKDVKPHYVELPGWQDARDSKQVAPFIEHIQNYTNTPVEYISVGVEDSDMFEVGASPENIQPTSYPSLAEAMTQIRNSQKKAINHD